MTRIRRTFIATLVASAVTAATFGVAPSSAVQATASSCSYSLWKIYKREHVTCRKAKKVMKHDPGIGGQGDELPGWHCTTGQTIIPEGKCSKQGTNKSFKYKQK
jgi:hypothetical protein